MDRLGRVHVPAARRELLLDEFERCGVSAAQFAKGIGVNYATFATWRQKRARRRAAEQGDLSAAPVTAMPALQWVEAVVEGAGGESRDADQTEVIGRGRDGSIWIELPGGGRVEMRDVSEAKLVAALLRAVVGRGCEAC